MVEAIAAAVTGAIAGAVTDSLAKVLGNVASELTVKQVSIQTRDFEGGARWYSAVDNGLVVSAYFHPTMWHSATAQRIGAVFHTKRKEAKSRAKPGEWAVDIVNKGMGTVHTFYKNE